MATAQGNPLTDIFLSRLDEGGYRVTESRQEVALAVFRQQDHFSVEDICRLLPTVGRATVFRNIKLMLEMNLVCRVVLEDGGVQYQVAERRHHHHLVCTRCGRTTDLLGCDFEDELRAKAKAQGMLLESHRLEVYGRCTECQAA
ncbi:MAG: transcriptional repressor [Dehalococcoidia bacterium]|nr:transcriptional repressor [Dehalococcoidia bacterium]